MQSNDLTLDYPPVFVGGLRRSGTTLMRKVLGSHSQLSFLPTELNFFEKFFDGTPLDKERQGVILREIVQFLNRKNCPLSEDHIAERLLPAEKSWRNLFVALVDEYRISSSKLICGEKSPLYEFYLPYLDAWFGQAGYRFVHIIRDPLSNYASHVANSKDLGLKHPAEWALAWNRSTSIALKNAHSHPDTYMYVLYDDFVKSPEKHLNRICAFLGIVPQLERMQAMTDFDWQITDNSSFLEQSGQQASYEGKIRTGDSVDRAGLLDENAKSIIYQYCSPLASMLGYKQYFPHLYETNTHHEATSMDLLRYRLDQLSFADFLAKIEVKYFCDRLSQGIKTALRTK